MTLNNIYKIKIELLVLFLLIAATTASYIVFLSYSPKVLQPVSNADNIKGMSNVYFELPLPKDSQAISTNQTLTSNNMIIKSSKSPDEIQQFYKNVMHDKGYEIESEKNSGGFFTREYKNEEKLITIVTTQQTNEGQNGIETIAGLEIKSR